MPRLACIMWVDNNLNSKCRNSDGEEITPIFVPHLPYNNILFNYDNRLHTYSYILKR